MMLRLCRAAVALAFLAACAPQPVTPLPMVAAGTAPFRAVAPAGYCPSAETEPWALEARQGLSLSGPPEANRQILGLFHRCDRPAPSGKADDVYGLIFQIKPFPVLIRGQPAMDRRTYVAILEDPSVLADFNQHSQPLARSMLAEMSPGMTVSDGIDLGSDDAAGYMGFDFTEGGPEAGSVKRSRLVVGKTLIRDIELTVYLTTSSVGGAPENWTALKQTTAQAIQSTVRTAEAAGP